MTDKILINVHEKSKIKKSLTRRDSNRVDCSGEVLFEDLEFEEKAYDI